MAVFSNKRSWEAKLWRSYRGKPCSIWGKSIPDGGKASTGGHQEGQDWRNHTHEIRKHYTIKKKIHWPRGSSENRRAEKSSREIRRKHWRNFPKRGNKRTKWWHQREKVTKLKSHWRKFNIQILGVPERTENIEWVIIIENISERQELPSWKGPLSAQHNERGNSHTKAHHHAISKDQVQR